MARIVSTGATLASPEFRDRKRKETRRKVAIWVVCIILLLVGFTLVSRIESLLIRGVSVSGARVISEEEIKRNVFSTLSGHYLWFIPRANAALYPGGRVESNLEKEFPRFSSVSVSLENINTISVSVVERTPFALYCPIIIKPEDVSSCFFLDKDGFIFDDAPAFSGNVYFMYTSVPAVDSPKGLEYMEQKRFQNHSILIEGISNLGFDPIALESSEEDTVLYMPEGLRIVWKSSDDLAKVYSNLESFLQSEEVKAMADFKEKVRLLDLRTENKVFYKF